MAKETTYPSGGTDSPSSPGSSHSWTADSGRRRPRWTRPSKRREVMLDLPHNSIKAMGEEGRRELDGGWNTNAGRSTAAMRAREAGTIGGGCFRTQRQGSEIRNLGGEPRGFIGGDGRKKGNRPPRSLGLPRAPPRHVAGHVPVVPILSPQKSRRTVRLPQANPDSLPTGETQATKACSFLFGPPRAQKLAGRPN